MHYTTLGTTGLIVSRLALGTMTFGSAYGAIAKVNQAQANELVARAIDQGSGENRRTKLDFPPIDLEPGYDVVDKLGEIASAHEQTPAQVALAWMLTKPFITSIILGASNIGQLEMNLATIHLELAAEEVNALDELTAPVALYPNWMLTMFPDTRTEQAFH